MSLCGFCVMHFCCFSLHRVNFSLRRGLGKLAQSQHQAPIAILPGKLKQRAKEAICFLLCSHHCLLAAIHFHSTFRFKHFLHKLVRPGHLAVLIWNQLKAMERVWWLLTRIRFWVMPKSTLLSLLLVATRKFCERHPYILLVERKGLTSLLKCVPLSAQWLQMEPK